MSSGAKPKQRRTQVERRAVSERKLLLATAELIVERGLNNVSLIEIGRRAGYSHALVNHLFGTKSALLERLNHLVEQRFQERWQDAVAERDGAVGLSTFIETYLRVVIGSTEAVDQVHIVLWAESIAGTPESRPPARAWDRRYREEVAALIAKESSKHRSVDPRSAAFIVVGLLRGAAMQLLVDPDAMSLDDAILHVNAVVGRLLKVR